MMTSSPLLVAHRASAINGQEISADVDEQEQAILSVASGTMSRDELTQWIRAHAVPAGAV